MDIVTAKEIIAALADGVNPITGEVLPTDSVCNNADVVRAFYTVLSNIDPIVKKKVTQENAGKPWSEEDDELLEKMLKEGARKKDLQEYFKRSSSSINARFARLGLIDEKYNYWRKF